MLPGGNVGTRTVWGCLADSFRGRKVGLTGEYRGSIGVTAVCPSSQQRPQQSQLGWAERPGLSESGMSSTRCAQGHGSTRQAAAWGVELVGRSSFRGHIDHSVDTQRMLSPIHSLQGSGLRMSATHWVVMKDGLGGGERAGPWSCTSQP